MHRSRRFIAVTSIGLLMAACAGHTAHPGKPKLAKATPAASPSPSTTPSAGPSFNLPPDVHIVFDWPATGDPTRDQILTDMKTALTAYLYAKSVPTTNGVWQSYFTGPVLVQLLSYLDNRKQQNLGVIGTDRYRNAVVTAVQGDTAGFKACEDGTQYEDKNLKTNQAVPGSATSADTFIFSYSLKHNGVWQVVARSVSRTPC